MTRKNFISLCFLLVITSLFPISANAQDITIQRPTKNTQTAPDKKSNSGTTSKSSNKSTSVSEPSGYSNGHEWVDLGLSVKWATCNVGASSPSDYGDYYAWGETRTKSSYTGSNSVTYRKNMSSIAGNPSYDAARANWGSTWRMPTKAEIEELISKCKREWTTQGGHKGYKITGPNGNSIFLPAAGWRDGASLSYAGESGYYWSATPDEDYTYRAYYLRFSSWHFYGDRYYRYRGQSVRPILDSNSTTTKSNVNSSTKQTNTGSSASTPQSQGNNSSKQSQTSNSSISQQQTSNSNVQTQISEPTGSINGHGYVDLGLSVKWATCNVGASSPSDYGDYYAWAEIKTKSSYTEKNSTIRGKKMSIIKGDPKRDAARANWGSTWRMPTKEDIDELVNKCKWTWATYGGHKGYKVIGPNGNSIFLPAAGWLMGTSPSAMESYGYYWTATPNGSKNYAYRLSFNSSNFSRNWRSRYDGQSIRPVSE